MRKISIPIPAVEFNPPVYLCRKTTKKLILDGQLDKDFWADAPFTDEFLDIEGSHMPLPRFVTRAKMLWDEENLYIGAQLDGEEIWGYVTERDDVIFQDNDFEIFIDPDSDTQQYYEFEMNVLNTVWDLFLPVAYRDGGSGMDSYDMHGLKTAVYVDGSIQDPSAKSRCWSAEVVIPFKAVTECIPGKSAPKNGDYYRMNFSRVQWKVDVIDNRFCKRKDTSTGAALPEDNWVWSPTGVINIHYPELWSFVFFTDGSTDDTQYQIPEYEYLKWELRKFYYAEQIHRELKGFYTNDQNVLLEILAEYSPIAANKNVKPGEYRIETTTHTFEVSAFTSDNRYCVSILSNGRVIAMLQV